MPKNMCLEESVSKFLESVLHKRDNKRALKVIRSLHSCQKKQTDKIDLLCRDMVAAHREFSCKLATLSFVTSFYESILGCANLEGLLNSAIDSIRESAKDTDAAVFLLSEGGFDVHVAAAGVADSVEKGQFQNWFTRELVNTIGQMNHVCSLEQLLKMGLQGPPAIMKTISLAAIPLGQLGRSVGFVLVYRPAHRTLQREELSRLAAISTGLREAIQSFQMASSINP